MEKIKTELSTLEKQEVEYAKKEEELRKKEKVIPRYWDKCAWINSVGPDQTAPSGAVWSGPALFFHLIVVFWNLKKY